MSLVRTTSGLLFRDDFNRANGALGSGWVDNSSGRISVVSNKARHASTAVNGDHAYPANGLYAPFCVVQATLEPTESVVALLVTRFSPATGRGFAVSPPRVNTNGSPDLYAYNVSSGFTTQNTVPSGNWAVTPAASYTIKVYDSDTQRGCYVNGVLVFTQATVSIGTGRAGSSGTAAIGTRTTTGTRDYDSLCAYSGNSITVTNLPNGYSARSGGITAAASAGTATIALAGVMCPLANVEVLNGASVVVATITPSDGVWGGDAYRYNTVPAAPTVTVTNGDDFGEVSITLSAVSDADSGETHQGRVRVARVSAPGVYLFDSGWLAAPLAAQVATGLPLGEALVATALYKDAYEDGATGEATFTLPSWLACGEPPATAWTAC